MIPARWEHVKAIVQEAVGRLPAERAAFVAESCAGDELLAREVGSLLAADAEAGNFIETPALARPDLATILDDVQAPPSLPGRRLGPSQLVTVDPHYVVSNFTCGNAANYTEYCNRNVTKWLQQSDRELNDNKRLALIKKVGKVLASDIPMVPLYQRPTYLVYKTSVHGMVDNPTSQGPSFNAENWSKG